MCHRLWCVQWLEWRCWKKPTVFSSPSAVDDSPVDCALAAHSAVAIITITVMGFWPVSHHPTADGIAVLFFVLWQMIGLALQLDVSFEAERIMHHFGSLLFFQSFTQYICWTVFSPAQFVHEKKPHNNWLCGIFGFIYSCVGLRLTKIPCIKIMTFFRV